MKLMIEEDNRLMYGSTGVVGGVSLFLFSVACWGVVAGVWFYWGFSLFLLLPMGLGILCPPIALAALFYSQTLEFRKDDRKIVYRRRFWRKAASTEQQASFDDVNAVVISYSSGMGPDRISSYHLRLHLSTENLEMSPAVESGLGKAVMGAAEMLGYDSSEYRLEIDCPLNADDAREKAEKLANFGGFKLIDRIDDK